MISFDPTSTAFYRDSDYFQILRRLRDEAPVHRVADGLVTVARYDDIREVSRDPGRFRSGGGALVHDPIRLGRATGARSVQFLDPPDHGRARGVLSRRFTPNAVAALEPRVRELCCRVLDRVPVCEAPIDAVEHLAAPFPLLVMTDLLGIPDGHRPEFRRWSDAAAESTDRPPEDTAAALAELHDFVLAHVERKRREPGDDLTSLLVAAEVDGRALTTAEVFGWLVTLLIAGNETTRTLLAGGMEALAADPAQRSVLVADPTAISVAVEECLRWVTPIHAFCRTVVDDTTVGDVPVHAGDYLIMLYASGNRDERAFGPTADSFDVARPTNPLHLSFGFGEHHCMGAALARLEGRVFFEELLRRFPGFAVAGPDRRTASTKINGFESLPVVLGA